MLNKIIMQHVLFNTHNHEGFAVAYVSLQLSI